MGSTRRRERYSIRTRCCQAVSPRDCFGLKSGVPSDPISGPLPILPVGPGPDLVPVTIVTDRPGLPYGSVNIHCYQQTLTLTEFLDTVVMRSGGTLNGALPLDIMLVHLRCNL